MIDQKQMMEMSRKKLAEQNDLFMFFVRDGMTRQELQKNIDRRPGLWSKYERWLDKLPNEVKP